MQTLLAILAGGAAAAIFAAAPFPLLAQWRPFIVREIGSWVVVPTFTLASFLGCLITGAIAGRRSLVFGWIVPFWVSLLCLAVLRGSIGQTWPITALWLGGIIAFGAVGLILGSNPSPQPQPEAVPTPPESLIQLAVPTVEETDECPGAAITLPECPTCTGDRSS